MLLRKKHGLRRIPNVPPARTATRDLIALLRLMVRMTFVRTDLTLLFWRTLIWTARNNPGALHVVATQMVLFLHLGEFAKFVVRDVERQIDAIDREAEEPARADAGPAVRATARSAALTR